MAWKVEFSISAGKAFDKLDVPVKQRIRKFIRQRLEPSTNPRTLGAALTGPYAGRWKYRIGDYRLVCKLIDDRLIIVVLDVGHRSEIYE